MDIKTHRLLDSPALNRQVLTRIVESLKPVDGVWKKCAKCGLEWNKLTKRGVCFDCDGKENV